MDITHAMVKPYEVELKRLHLTTSKSGNLKATTLAPETSSKNWRHKFNTGLWLQFFVLIASGIKNGADSWQQNYNGRRLIRSSIYLIVMITQFNTKQQSIL